MQSKFYFSLLFSFLLAQFTLEAQVKYSSEEIKKTYEKETLVLTQNGYEKNGEPIHFNPVVPNQSLAMEIEKNGGKEAKIEYNKYRKTVVDYWLVSGLGFILAITPLIIVSNMANIASSSLGLLLGISLLGSLVLSLGAMFLARKLYRHLAYAVWHHNKNVLLGKPS